MLSLGDSPTSRSVSGDLGVGLETTRGNRPPRHQKSARKPPRRAPDPSLPTMEKEGGVGATWGAKARVAGREAE